MCDHRGSSSRQTPIINSRKRGTPAASTAGRSAAKSSQKKSRSTPQPSDTSLDPQWVIQRLASKAQCSIPVATHAVSFQWKNGLKPRGDAEIRNDFLLKNPDFLFRNPDFLLKNDEFIIKQMLVCSGVASHAYLLRTTLVQNSVV